MHTRNAMVFSGLVLVAGAAAAAESPWSMSVFGGDSVSAAGSLQAPGSTAIADLGALNPALAGGAGTLSLDRLRYQDLFKRRYDTGLELDYQFADNLQSYGRFDYESLGGRTRNFGEVSGAGLAMPSTLTARFADADNSSFELGSRYIWSTGSTLRPFLGAALGVTHLDAMRATLTSQDINLGLQNVRFTRAGSVFSQNLETGVEYHPSSSFGVRLSAEAQHLGAPSSANDAALAFAGLNTGKDAQSRWDFPLSVAANYHF